MLLSGGAAGGSATVIIVYLLVLVLIFYFMMIRPQKKEQKKMNEMLAAMEVGDIVVTTSGFYGVLVSITDEDCIVEFGGNKNCRIVMRKSAIAQIEKAE